MAAATTELEGSDVGRRSTRVRRAVVQVNRYPWLFVGLLSIVAWSLALRNQYPLDYRVFTGAGNNLLHLRLGSVFADPKVQAGPLTLFAFGVWQEAVTGLGLSASLTVSAAVLVLCFNNAGCAVVITRVLSRRDPLRSGLAVILAGALALANGALTLDEAHPTHAWIALLWVLVVRAAQRGAAVQAGLLLGLACDVDSWGVLGLGILLVLPGLRDGRNALVAAGAACLLAWGPFALTGQFHSAGMTWRSLPGSLPALLFGDDELPWTYRLAQAVAVVGASAVIARRARRWRDAAWLLPTLVFSLRLATDPRNYGYYNAPFIILLIAGLSVRGAEHAPGPMPRGAAQLAWIRRTWSRLEVLALGALVAAALGQALYGPLLGYGVASLMIAAALLVGEPERQGRTWGDSISRGRSSDAAVGVTST